MIGITCITVNTQYQSLLFWRKKSKKCIVKEIVQNWKEGLYKKELLVHILSVTRYLKKIGRGGGQVCLTIQNRLDEIPVDQNIMSFDSDGHINLLLYVFRLKCNGLKKPLADIRWCSRKYLKWLDKARGPKIHVSLISHWLLDTPFT